MAQGLAVGDGPQAGPVASLEQAFNDQFPQYLAIGMPAEEFWHGEPSLCRGYREAWRIRQDSAMASEWRQGQYFLAALSTALDKSLNGGKGGAEYPERPIGMSDEWNAAQDEQEQRAVQEGLRERIEIMNSHVES